MSKPVKELMRKEMIRRFKGLTSLAIVDFTGVDATATNRIRARLRAQDIQVSVVKNSLARQAFKEIGLEAAAGLLDGPSAVAWGSDPDKVGIVTVVRELLDINSETPALTVKAALLEGDVFGAERIEELSKYPTRQEAVARVVGCALSGGGKLAGALLGPGARLAAAVKAVEETQEGGETAAE